MLGRTLTAGFFSAALILLNLVYGTPKEASPVHLNNSVDRANVPTTAPSATSKADEKVTSRLQTEPERNLQTQQPSPQTQEKTIEKVGATEPEKVQPTAKPAVQTVLTDKEQLMQAAGIPESDWNAVDYIVSHESSWRVQATNPESGAYGLCQALPASKMASAGADWKNNPVTQLKWCHAYANDRYGSWWKAHAFWQAARWW